MPLIQVHMFEGRSDDEKRELLRAISDAVQTTLDMPVEQVRVWISEFGPNEVIAAGRLIGTDEADPTASGRQ